MGTDFMTISVNASGLFAKDGPASISTTAALENSLASDLAQPIDNKERWQRVIDERLIEWGRYPHLLEDDDLISPTHLALQSAARLAIAMRDKGLPPPTRVVPDRDGGIAFEKCDGERTTTIMISSVGSMEALIWLGSNIISQQRLG